ncbi:hypothetical protein PoMZ_07749 [Pyricularia oryzae]|uniref:Uncharacterized protein n=1 Tax=Pyricularia oryzae TaxID=318829 RepID=A0A4P7NFY2_PYROR|nr:hypothetical protein PoMZ_07749 [Pyricularia oryzae]
MPIKEPKIGCRFVEIPRALRTVSQGRTQKKGVERKALATEETRVPGEPGDVPMGNPGFVSSLAGSASHYAL